VSLFFHLLGQGKGWAMGLGSQGQASARVGSRAYRWVWVLVCRRVRAHIRKMTPIHNSRARSPQP